MDEMRFSCAGAHRLLALALLLAAGLAAQQSPDSAPTSSSRAHKPAARLRLAGPDAGVMADGVYRNSFFGFSYKVPYGWVDRTDDMREGEQSGKAMLLLAIFERPPDATGDTVNSAVVITAENVSSYPGLKTAADYFAPLTELTTSKGFKVVNEPYESSAGAKQLVRSDFSKQLGTLTMQQSSLVLVEKSYVISFTLIGGSGDEVDSLIENLGFGVSRNSGLTKSSDHK
jgi:hypothetical protein